ncbi:MAG: malate synthase [Vicinamibacterales bacterium]
MIEISRQALSAYPDVFTAATTDALGALAGFERDRRELMAARLARRNDRAVNRRPIEFLDAGATIGRTRVRVQAARDGQFAGPEIPADLQRQWIQGTGPGARPNTPLTKSLRNVAYALLSGADGWMFDGEDALGQLGTMSLDNQRNLRLAIGNDPRFLAVAETVSAEMNAWAGGFFGRPIVTDWQCQLGFTTKIFRARGLHLDDRHVRSSDGSGFSASIVDLVLYVVANHRRLTEAGSSIVLYLPKIQTAEEAALWNDMLSALEMHLGLTPGTIKTYVLVEQLEAVFQLMEIRAALGLHFVGFNTGRWDYINSVSDAMAWDPAFINPNIDVITMTYPYMRAYEDRVRRAVNTPDRNGRFALWQGGMEPNIPVGSADGVRRAMERAVAGAHREQQAGASGKWVAHWKMVHIVRPVWEAIGETNQSGRTMPPLTYTAADAQALTHTEEATRSVRGARDLISVAVQYANAFGQGMQAAALKPADSFGDDDVLYLMEDMATAEIRVSILWEWLHKRAGLADSGGAEGAVIPFTVDVFDRLLAEEYSKLVSASNRDVHDDSKRTTLPIARDLVQAFVTSAGKLPWFVDLLNTTLGVHDVTEARARIESLRDTFLRQRVRVTANLDFDRDGLECKP